MKSFVHAVEALEKVLAGTVFGIFGSFFVGLLLSRTENIEIRAFTTNSSCQLFKTASHSSSLTEVSLLVQS